MAQVWFTGTSGGNSSVAANWNTGSIPTSADDVFANGKTVVIDAAVTWLSGNTTAGTMAVAGGNFTPLGGLTISATNGWTAGASTCVLYTNTSGLICTVNGNVTGSAVTGSAVGARNASTGATPGTLNINGNVTAGPVGNSHGASSTGTGNLNIVGNVNGTPSSANSSAGVSMSAGTGSLTVLGNVTGGVGSNSVGIDVGTNNVMIGASGNTFNVTGGAGANTYGISAINLGAARLTVWGNVTGSSTSPTGTGVVNNGTGGLVTVNGNISAGSTTSGAAGFAQLALASTLTVNGNSTGGAGNSIHGIFNGGTHSPVIHNGNSTGGTGGNASGYYASNANGTSHYTLTGNATGGSLTTNCGVYGAQASTCIQTVSGIVSGGPGVFGGPGLYGVSSSGIVIGTAGSAVPGAAGAAPLAGIVFFASLPGAKYTAMKSDLTTQLLQAGGGSVASLNGNMQ
jgi:fibronectin-binding autotransporter adhesin